MAGKETARPYLTMSGGSCNVDPGAISAATDLDFGRESPPPRSVRDEATVAQKETARPYFTMSSGHYNLAQGTSSAPSDLDESRVPEETREAGWQQRGNQAANIIEECRICGFALADMEDFEKHAADHLLGKSNICSQCGKLFAHPWLLTRHLRTHGEPSFECGVCGKKFYRKDVRKKHMLARHAGAQD
ncbi:zinc finger protein weckle-like [Dermacentor andersoni]|uniref:zinc finger protein weckle-like n=1 Tax=Dermacentor andersoni TaxID=34620 RepID=UPI0024165F3D|nr:zinc finger protein 418-like [Dermacentor andersoni]